MATIIMLLTMLAQVATPTEMSCAGFIRRTLLPMDLYIAGTDVENSANFGQGSLVYANGPGISSLKPGETYRVVRAEGKVKNPRTGEPVGFYYMELGYVRIESVGSDSAVATVLMSCREIYNGDLLLPESARAPVEFDGQKSNRLTPYPEGGLTSSILLGKDGAQELAAGNFCFIGVGTRDGVKPGDRFTIYRLPQTFSEQDVFPRKFRNSRSYESIAKATYGNDLAMALARRSLPPRPLGDLIVIDASETTATAKIIYSMSEIHPGDIVVRR